MSDAPEQPDDDTKPLRKTTRRKRTAEASQPVEETTTSGEESAPQAEEAEPSGEAAAAPAGEPAPLAGEPAPLAEKTAPRAERPAPRAAQRAPFGYLLLWVLASASLIMNALMLRQVIIARDIARQTVSDAEAVIDNLQSQSFVYTVVIDENLPVRTDVPLDMTIPVIINETIPIATTVTVPVDTVVFGIIPVRVPFSTAIAVNFEQEIVIDETLTIDTIVPVYIEVPIDLKIRDTPLSEMLNDLKARLEELERNLSTPLVPIPRVNDAP